MELLVRAFRIPESRLEELKDFSQELLERRRRDTESMFRRFGIESEVWHLHRTPSGPVLVMTTWISDLDKAPKAFAASRDPFHMWFKQQVLRISDVDPGREPLGPPQQPVFEWRNEKAPIARTARAAKAGRQRVAANAKKTTRR